MPKNNKKKNSAGQKINIILKTNNPDIKITNVKKADRKYNETPEPANKVQAIQSQWNEFRQQSVDSFKNQLDKAFQSGNQTDEVKKSILGHFELFYKLHEVHVKDLDKTRNDRADLQNEVLRFVNLANHYLKSYYDLFDEDAQLTYNHHVLENKLAREVDLKCDVAIALETQLHKFKTMDQQHKETIKKLREELKTIKTKKASKNIIKENTDLKREISKLMDDKIYLNKKFDRIPNSDKLIIAENENLLEFNKQLSNKVERLNTLVDDKTTDIEVLVEKEATHLETLKFFQDEKKEAAIKLKQIKKEVDDSAELNEQVLTDNKHLQAKIHALEAKPGPRIDENSNSSMISDLKHQLKLEKDKRVALNDQLVKERSIEHNAVLVTESCDQKELVQTKKNLQKCRQMLKKKNMKDTETIENLKAKVFCQSIAINDAEISKKI